MERDGELVGEQVDGEVGGLGIDELDLDEDESVSEEEEQLISISCWVGLGWAGVSCVRGLRSFV